MTIYCKCIRCGNQQANIHNLSDVPHLLHVLAYSVNCDHCDHSWVNLATLTILGNGYPSHPTKCSKAGPIGHPSQPVFLAILPNITCCYPSKPALLAILPNMPCWPSFLTCLLGQWPSFLTCFLGHPSQLSLLTILSSLTS